jgi:hypothetical protein
MRVVKISNFKEECAGCPSAWSGETDDGEFYVRYRWGVWRIYIDDRLIQEGESGRSQVDGICSFEELAGWALENDIALVVVSRAEHEDLLSTV